MTVTDITDHRRSGEPTGPHPTAQGLRRGRDARGAGARSPRCRSATHPAADGRRAERARSASTTPRGRGRTPRAGSAPLRLAWITGRGRRRGVRRAGSPTLRDDGRAARCAGPRPPSRSPARAGAPCGPAGRRRGHPAPLRPAGRDHPRDGVRRPPRGAWPPRTVRDEVAAGRAIIPANVNHPESEPMAIGTAVPGEGQRQHRQLGGDARRWPRRSRS